MAITVATTQRHGCQRRRVGQTLQNQADSGAPTNAQGISEVTGQGIAQEGEVLDVDRPVQAPGGPYTSCVINGGFQWQKHVQRIAGNPGKGEHDDGEDQQSQNGLTDSEDDVALHFDFLLPEFCELAKQSGRDIAMAWAGLLHQSQR